MYTETFTFSFGHYYLDSFVFPHLFSIPFIMSALLYAAAAGVSPPTSERWAGVGRESGGSWAFLQASTRQICPLHSPPQIPFAPSVPISTPEPSYLTDILDLYWGYLGRILTISLAYTLGLSHFLNTFNILSQFVHHTCTTFWLHLLNSYVE